MRGQLTELGKNQLETVKTDYPKLLDNYNELMGNFEFTTDQFIEKTDEIIKWLKKHETFRIISQDDYIYLTDF
mgnify:FL=1